MKYGRIANKQLRLDLNPMISYDFDVLRPEGRACARQRCPKAARVFGVPGWKRQDLSSTMHAQNTGSSHV